MAQFKFVLWLAEWLFSEATFGFDWNAGNSTKNVNKHAVSIEEAEQIFYNVSYLVPLGIQVSPETHEERFAVLGKTLDHRQLAICFTIRAKKIRIISARPMSSKERKHYAKIREK